MHESAQNVPNEDLISRKTAIDALADLPSAQPKTADSGSVEKEIPEIKTDRTTGGMIYRQDAFNAVIRLPKWNDELFSSVCLDYGDVIDALENLSSAQPDMSEYSDKLWRNAYERGKTEALERKRGRWIRKSTDGIYWFECEKCGARPLLNAWHKGDELSEFCPRCGAWLRSDMRGEQ